MARQFSVDDYVATYETDESTHVAVRILEWGGPGTPLFCWVIAQRLPGGTPKKEIELAIQSKVEDTAFFGDCVECHQRLPAGYMHGDDYCMEKLLSGFSVTGKAKDGLLEGGDGASDDPFAGMSEAQARSAMHELEKTVGSMDEENPDPRQMGQLMRKMAEMTGEIMDEGMEEVIRRLEEGADPDELEDTMGDLLGEDDDAESEGQAEVMEEGAAKGKGRRLNQPKPIRDPEMYEMSDYL